MFGTKRQSVTVKSNRNHLLTQLKLSPRTVAQNIKDRLTIRAETT